MDTIWIIGGFAGLVLALWATYTPMPENKWTLLSLFGIGGAVGGALAFVGITILVIVGEPSSVGSWILTLVGGFGGAIVGCILGRLAAALVGLVWKQERHRALYAMALGFVAGLMTGSMFGGVTMGSGALEALFGRFG